MLTLKYHKRLPRARYLIKPKNVRVQTVKWKYGRSELTQSSQSTIENNQKMLLISLNLLLSFSFVSSSWLIKFLLCFPTSLSFEIHSPTEVSSQSISISLERRRERLSAFVVVFGSRKYFPHRTRPRTSPPFTEVSHRYWNDGAEKGIWKFEIPRENLVRLVLIHFN